MKIELAYGKKGLEFEMPSQAKPVVIRKPPFEIPEDSPRSSEMPWKIQSVFLPSKHLLPRPQVPVS